MACASPGEQLVAKRGYAGGLEPNDRGAATNLRAEDVEGFAPARSRTVEHAPVIKRPPAAQRRSGMTIKRADKP